LKNKKLTLSAAFEKQFARLPRNIRETTYDKLGFLLKDPAHPSLRVKKVKGTDTIWEMSITMNYRVTFQVGDDEIILRNIGTHDLLRNP
jgi:mRNA-degrading endonuclease RelE of RelBE toxin-antitoxin system